MFFDASSTSTAKQEHITAGDAARIIKTRGKVSVAEAGSLQQGEKSKYLNTGAFDFTDASNVTINAVDGGVLEYAGTMFSAALAAQDAQQERFYSNTANSASLLSFAFQESLARTQSGGASDFLKPILIFAGLVTGGLLVFVAFKK